MRHRRRVPGNRKDDDAPCADVDNPPQEKIVTIETERELYLNKMPERHWQVQDLQYIPPQSAGADSAAGFSLDQCFSLALRSSAERILFAEIRGPEGPIAIKAMQAGKGSMSTIHARSADDTIHRFADVLMSELGLSDDTVPLRQIERSIDIIVYIDFLENPDGTRRRVVTEVAEVTRNLSDGHPMAANLFKYDADIDDWTNRRSRRRSWKPRSVVSGTAGRRRSSDDPRQFSGRCGLRGRAHHARALLPPGASEAGADKAVSQHPLGSGEQEDQDGPHHRGILGIVAAVISGFPVMVIVVPAAITIVPALLGKPSTYERDLILALENWARSLASTADTGAFTLREVIGITRAACRRCSRPRSTASTRG